ncbi:uncharacterized protein MKZ38_005655 [Zalerion maritima]|uniref:Uncharacterized protein n=1 Tax=Zalerion maritima TaxID=339359 RepID=A0AAD5RXY1_9PEZI|nr:uncharacterized protein MKZ38_005655 [Zalerion maritima]
MGPAGAQPSLRPWQSSQSPESRSASQQQRRDRHDESWVEISSQPSSSSLSSIGDEVITTGLRVGSPSYGPRQRRLAQSQRRVNNRQSAAAGITAASSSPEEYEETESEDDHFLTSSGERLSVPTTPSRRVIHPDTDSDGGDENATALGRRVPDSPPSFKPQPNAFSHPPAPPTFPSNHPHSAVRGGPGGVRSLQHQRHGGPSFMASGGTSAGTSSGGAYQPDNDAALRASLTTLLSCAAAARGAPRDPKDVEGIPLRPGGRVSPGDQPMELRLVQEADLLAESPSSPPAAPSFRRQSSGGSSSRKVDDKGKRRSATPTVKSPRATKKKRMTLSSEETLINPTLLTWVVSAGVVVLVSVVGFGAGYVIGREVGKQEGMTAAAGGLNATSVGETAAGCGREVIRGSGGTLRKFRWGTGIARSVVAS